MKHSYCLSAQVILNAGDAYQTVTIVPSEAGSGEVSYVLIVQQPDDKDGDKGEGDGEDQDLTVYDFDEGEEGMPVVSYQLLMKRGHV